MALIVCAAFPDIDVAIEGRVITFDDFPNLKEQLDELDQDTQSTSENDRYNKSLMNNTSRVLHMATKGYSGQDKNVAVCSD